MWLALDQWFLDAKFGLRQLGRAPLVATAAVVTLALGIGLNTAVFSLVHAVLLRPLPYPTRIGSRGLRRITTRQARTPLVRAATS